MVGSDDPSSRLLGVLRESQEAGFLGPGPVGEHVRHARAFVEVLGEGFDGRAIDLGSGGGVPGLVLAVALPASSWRLVDARLRRVRFLERAVGELGLGGRVEAVHRRAEELGRDPAARSSADAVVVRSLARPAVVAELAAPLLRTGGVLVVSEPPQPAPDRWPASEVGRFGLELVACGTRAGFRLAELRQIEACPVEYPRRPGVPERAPRF